MRATSLRKIAVAFVLLTASGGVKAIPIEVNFTASNLFPLSSTVAVAPQDPISGSFILDAPSLTSTTSSLLSISLAIDGHTYTSAEVSASAFGATQEIVFGNLAVGTPPNPQGVLSLTDDFWLIWDVNSLTPVDFVHTSSNIGGVWRAGTFTSFSVTAVPEPASLALLGIGLAGLGFARKK